MKVYFMKQSAMDYIKANIGTLYKNYFTFDSPEWIYALLDYDPFEVIDTVDDFELADLSLPPGEIDLQNSKILYEKLKFLSDSQAADERLWAGLCNKNFYPYLRKRWEYARKHLKKTSDDSSAILMRYFYKHTGRSGMFRNTLARCWWTGRLTYTEKYANKWELLDAIGPEDWVSKVSDIFYSNNFSSNKDILEGFCQGLKFFRNRGIRVANREHIRPCAQYLNALGGGVLLDMLDAEEIRKLVIERLGILIKGLDPGIFADLDEEEDRIDQEPADLEEDFAEDEVNVDYEDYMDSLESVTDIDLDSVLGELTEVEYGCQIHLKKMPKDEFFILRMPLAGEELNLMQKKMLGQKIGFVWRLGREAFEIVDIRR